MSFKVLFSLEAEDDLVRIFDFLLSRARVREDLAAAQEIIESIRHAAQHQLAVTPYSFRKVGASSTRRELIIPYGASGYIAQYEIVDSTTVLVLAIRHQREEDYH
ncbi:MAG: type II toxin-antitoxin system RelE/ParE family toxin [Pseudomonadota bacterium]|nr:type II toxin-antitoxin system RelE/ParE family toxin [Pseudomonadota bacterium]